MPAPRRPRVRASRLPWALAAGLLLACALPRAARADLVELEYQFQLQSTLLYCDHWFSGHDPGPSLPDAQRKAILLPPVVLWRNAPGAALHLETRHSQWDLAYNFGYDWFALQNLPPSPGGAPRWTSEGSLNSYENRFDAIGRVELAERRSIVVVERFLQSAFNLFSVPPLAQTMPQTVGEFDLTGLTFVGSTTRAMLEQRFAKNWELRPEVDVEAFKILGTVPAALASVLGSRGLFTLQSSLFRHSDHDVFEANASWTYVGVSTPPDLPSPTPGQPPISQAQFGRDYMVLHGYVGWSHQFARWFAAQARVGYAANTFAHSEPGDTLYHGLIGGLRLRLHDDWWDVVLEYAREFDTSIWGASVIHEDVGSLELRRRLGEHLILWAHLTINRRNVREPNADAALGPLGAPIDLPQFITYDTVGTTYRFTDQLALDVMVTFRKQWGEGVALPYQKWIPGIQVTYLWPQRTAPPLRMDDAVRRLTREPLDDERRSEHERGDRDRLERLRQQQRPLEPGVGTEAPPRPRVPTAPARWMQPQERPEGAPPPEDRPPPRDEPASAR
ncbi:MAG TPA: hypothetical protein VGQ83_16150 [Polyangia bacterium]|jgi:hypothetical protein